VSSKPENTFIASVHEHLPALVPGEAGAPYREKMYNPLRGGTWDCWYSGMVSDLWVEYKFVNIPTRDSTIIRPNLSDLQLYWGKSRLLEGRKLAVIIGSKDGGVIMRDREWEVPISAKDFKARLKTRKELAQFLIDQTVGGP